MLLWFKSYQGLEESLFKLCLYNLPIKLMPQFLLVNRQLFLFLSELSRCIFMKYTGGTRALKSSVWFFVGEVLELPGKDVA